MKLILIIYKSMVCDKKFFYEKRVFFDIDCGCFIKSCILEDMKSMVKMKILFMFFVLFISFYMGKY